MAVVTSNATKKNIVVLGGSYVGVSAAHYTLKHTIPALTGGQYEEKLFVDLAAQFKQYPQGQFAFLQGTATSLDHTARTVTITTHDNIPKTLSYYALVIATGATTPSPLLTPSPDIDALKASWKVFRGTLPNARHILIAGAGPAGVEVAGELGEYLNGRAGWFASENPQPKVKITLISASKQILPYLRADIAQLAEGYLAKLGVTVLKGVKVVGVEPENVGTAAVDGSASVSLSDGTTMDVDLYIPASGMSPNSSYISKALLAEDGRVRTNAKTLRVEEAGERVYALGDVSNAGRPAVHNVLDGLPVLGGNLKRDLLAAEQKPLAGEDKVFMENVKMTQLVPIGTSKGVGVFMGWRMPSWAVWLIKGRDYWLWTTGGLWSGKQWTKEK